MATAGGSGGVSNERGQESVDQAVAQQLRLRQLSLPRRADGDYRSRFKAWEQQASVRTRERRMLDRISDEESTGKMFFPAKMVPTATHPAVASLGRKAVRKLQIHHLHIYLEFTAELEQSVVNPVAQRISRRRVGVRLPSKMQEDAYKICTDEAWHAQFSDDLQRQIEQATRVLSVLPQYPAFMERLAHTEHMLGSADNGLARLFFAIVSETLISSFLADIPSDPTVIFPVRELVADHAMDEGRHHAYFAQVLQWVWPSLGKREQTLAREFLPEFVLGFLEPDLRAVAGVLMDCGLRPEATKHVLADVYPEGKRREAACSAARHTMKHLWQVGVLDDPRALEAFTEAGLIEPS